MRFTAEDAEKRREDEPRSRETIRPTSGPLGDRHLNEVSGQVVDAAIAVHSALGPGLLESAYQAALAFELRDRGIDVEAEVPVPLVYRDIELQVGYRLDLLVDNEVVVEVKSVDALLPIHQAQLLSYLKLSKKRLGLLINFNVLRLKNGIKRLVHHL